MPWEKQDTPGSVPVLVLHMKPCRRGGWQSEPTGDGRLLRVALEEDINLAIFGSSGALHRTRTRLIMDCNAILTSI